MRSWQKKLPMWLTWSRMIAILPLLFLLWPNYPQLNLIAALLYAVAAFTDYLDGYYARKFHALSNEGKLLDPIADKVLVTGLLIVFVHRGHADPFMVTLILGRDLLIGGLRSVAALEGFAMSAQKAGKWKTAIQMLALPLVMLQDNFANPLVGEIGYWVLWIGAILSLTSGWSYYSEYRKQKIKKVN